MEIKSINAFLSYYDRARQVTNKVIQVVPHDKIDWSYKPGKFTIGDMIRHIAAIERYAFAEVAIGNKPAYKGCGKELADGYDNIVSYFNEMHTQTIKIFSSLTDEDLTKNVKTLDGKDIILGNFLRALIVHEIHHRGILCIYLNMLNIVTPPVLGFTEAQVIQVSNLIS